jgi:hypothetical protein
LLESLTKNKYTYAGQNKTPLERGLMFLETIYTMAFYTLSNKTLVLREQGEE